MPKPEMPESNGVKKWREAMWVVVAALNLQNIAVVAEPQVPCLFIFGDSVLDNGNNNNMLTVAKATFWPYGIDFPGGATGRFSNGKTAVDVLAQLLDFDDYIPSYVSARGNQILRGVNYASAAGGIRPETGRQVGNRTNFGGQVKNFKNTAAQIAGLLGNQSSAVNHLSKCIYVTAIGGNDLMNNYLLPKLYTTSLRYSLPQYLTLLIQLYSDQIKLLYSYGARKVAVVGIAPSGCVPSALAKYSADGTTCVEKINRVNRMFNKRLRALVDDFNANSRDAQFTYINIYDIFQDVVNNASAYGFKVTKNACCGQGKNNAVIICLPLEKPCENRDKYVFWDFFHPTEAAHTVFATKVYRVEKASYAHPYDIRRLAQL